MVSDQNGISPTPRVPACLPSWPYLNATSRVPVAFVLYCASEAVGRIADRAVQIHGGAGYMADYKVKRFYRDVRLLRIYKGTSQIQQIIIAREMQRAADANRTT